MPEENEKALPDFAVWRTENLVRFAQDCTLELRRLAQENERLAADLRVAIDAYRVLIRRQADDDT